MMSIVQLLFCGFAATAGAAALAVILSNNPVRSALFLVAAFLATAVTWLLAQAEFLALVLILVYVGAVMTLFLFVVMMLSIETQYSRRSPWFYLGALVLAVALGLALYSTIQHWVLPQVPVQTVAVSNVHQLGSVLYTDYAFAFELAAVLLLVAIVAAISLVHRTPRNAKTQNPVAQIRVNSSMRIRYVSGKESL
jgi:NADH-quinone oxidoreductase subunit J